jgi:oxygen-dependent protoporphyrinogen oxidase
VGTADPGPTAAGARDVTEPQPQPQADGESDALDAVVVGGGIAGLAAAFRLSQRGARVRLIEAASRPGGAITSEARDGFIVEWGPNTVRGGGREAIDLADAVGLREQRIFADAAAKKRYILHPTRKRLIAVGMGALVLGSLLGPWSKWRLATEVLRRAKRPPKNGAEPADPPDETIASFVQRRLTRQFADRLIAPVVSGVYAGDIDQLSMRAVFPQMLGFEEEHGGMVRGALALMRRRRAERRRGESEPVDKRLYSYADGFRQFPEAIAAALGDQVMLGRPAVGLSREPGADGRWRVQLGDPGATAPTAASGAPTADPARTLTTRHVVLATPAAEAAALISPLAPDLAAELGGIDYAPMAVVALGFERADVGHPLDGFGFLIPRVAGVTTLGSLWSSSLFPNRAPAGKVLLTNFIGGATNPDALDRSDAEIIGQVRRDIAGPLKLKPGAEPVFAALRRWPRAIAQYNLGHPARMKRIDAELAARPGLHLAGNYLTGVSVNDVAAIGLRVADGIADRP